MKIKTTQHDFQPIQITIETREELVEFVMRFDMNERDVDELVNSMETYNTESSSKISNEIFGELYSILQLYDNHGTTDLLSIK